MKMTMRYAHVSITDVEEASKRIGDRLNDLLGDIEKSRIEKPSSA